MERKICCLCHKANEFDRWSQATTRQQEDAKHGLCPSCFAEIQEKVKRIYAPVSVQMQATSKLAALPEVA